MKSFGLAQRGSVLIRVDDRAHFDVVFLAIDRAYVQRTLCLREFSKWLRRLPGGRLGGVSYDDVAIGEKLTCELHPGACFVVLAKDEDTRNVIVAEGLVTMDHTCWELAIPQ